MIYPVVLARKEHYTLWYKKDTTFLQLKAKIYVEFVSLAAYDSPQTAAMTDFYVLLLDHLLKDVK